MGELVKVRSLLSEFGPVALEFSEKPAEQGAVGGMAGRLGVDRAGPCGPGGNDGREQGCCLRVARESVGQLIDGVDGVNQRIAGSLCGKRWVRIFRE